jgi:capsular polysaccharide transport system permease protein
LSEGGLSASDEAVSTAEIESIRVAAENGPAVDQEYPAIKILIPPLEREAAVEQRVGFWRRHALFIVTVVLPMAVAVGFFVFVFAPRYSSTVTFRVSSISSMGAQFKTALLGLTVPIISEDSYAVDTYLTSREMVNQLVKTDNLRAILDRSQVDFVFHYPTFWLPDNDEFLYRRFQWMAKVDLDPASGISTMEVNAFTPGDAQALAQAMVRYAEALVDRMNQRLYQDQLTIADRYVAEAQKEVDSIEAELKAFRNVSGSLDPNLVAQSELNVIQGLSTQLAQVEASIVQQLKTAPTSPLVRGMLAQAQSYRDEIKKRNLEIAGTGGSEAVKLQTYDLLTLRRSLALQALGDAVLQRELARQYVEQQHLYIELISKPNLADWPRYPQTTFVLLALLGICLAVFQVLRYLDRIAAQHVQ